MNKTIEYYNNNANKFISDTLDCKFNILQDKFINYLPTQAHILDLGCGSCRDSKYFKNKGFIITAIDGSQKICDIASEVLKQDVICCDFKDLEYKNEFDGIWACASLLHVEHKNLLKILIKCCNAIKDNGIFYMSFKYGNFEGYRNDRYFTDLTEESFKQLIKNIPQFIIKELFVSNDVRVGREDEQWLNIFVSVCK
jgi:2-polyprenyl-3-methyl-5-hydroxy-6-metoxy-1,4-benzoquinol methylase